MSRSFLINLISIKMGRIYGSVQRRHRPSKRRISQSETSTINICDIVNTMALQHGRVSGYRNVTSSVFKVIVRLPRYLDIIIPAN